MKLKRFLLTIKWRDAMGNMAAYHKEFNRVERLMYFIDNDLDCALGDNSEDLVRIYDRDTDEFIVSSYCLLRKIAPIFLKERGC